MNDQIKSWISYFLLLCITGSVIPLNLWHHHESVDIVCADPDSTEEKDPCHQTISHPYHAEDFQCEHQTHLNKTQEDCEFCELLTTRHNFYIQPTIEWLNPTFLESTEFLFVDRFIPFSDIQIICNRGPPA